MFSSIKALFVAVIVAVATPCTAQERDPGNVELEARELSAEIIGARVSDSSGVEVGEVADISFDEDGRPDRLRVRTSSILGFGERTVEVPRGAYMLLRGHVVLEISADDLRSLPEVGDDIDDKRAE
jgi:sporulation protein YlmC with PRC-barrel domain